MISWPEPKLPPINLYNAPRQKDYTMSRTRRWLKINDKVNTLTGHMVAHGYTRKKVDTIAKHWGCKGSELTTDTLSKFFGAKVEDVDQPENWQEIMYGSERGAQRHVPKGRPKSRGVNMQKEPIANGVERFLTMTLSRNPASYSAYY